MKINVLRNVFFRSSEAQKSRGDIWFLHAYADTGFAFAEAFSSVLAEEFNLFVPDCPGFGVSPALRDNSMPATANFFVVLMREVSQDRPIYIVAHSVSSIIGTAICRALGQQINGFFCIEGNLTESDAYFSSLITQCPSAQDFHKAFLETIFNRAKDDPAFQRFWAGIQVASLAGLEGWGRSSALLSRAQIAGKQFQDLTCRKLYYWDVQSTSPETQQFIWDNAIPNMTYKSGGHWPMIKQPDICYQDMYDFFVDALAGQARLA